MKKGILCDFICGLFSGLICGFFGAGGGLVLTAYITLIKKEDEIVTRATTILCIFCMSIISSFLYCQEGMIDWNLALKCSIGGIVGRIYGF